MYISDLATAQRICYGSRLIYTQILEQDFLLHIKVSKFVEFQFQVKIQQIKVSFFGQCRDQYSQSKNL